MGFGPMRVPHEIEHHVHESPPSMIVPLAVLEVLSIVGGLVGPPMQEGGSAFERWLHPVFASEIGRPEAARAASPATDWMLIVVSVLAALAGIAWAFRAYLQRPALATRMRESLAGLHRALLHKYWIDERYDAVVVRPIHAGSVFLWRFWDEKIVDGTVNGIGFTFEGVSAILRLFQTGFVGTYALFFTLGVAALLFHLLRARP